MVLQSFLFLRNLAAKMETWMGSIRNVDCGSFKRWRAALPAGVQKPIPNPL